MEKARAIEQLKGIEQKAQGAQMQVEYHGPDSCSQLVSDIASELYRFWLNSLKAPAGMIRWRRYKNYWRTDEREI